MTKREMKEVAEMIDLARADERAKLAGLYFSKEAVDAMIAEERGKLSKGGVRVWVSWDNDDVPYISKIQPQRHDINGTILYLFSGIHYDKLPYWLIDSMKLQRGECKAFEIRECKG